MTGTAVVIGSGPNGLAAGIVLAQAGLDVEIRESANIIGGATRSGELTLPGFVHDLGSAVHPLGVASPFFSTLNLPEQGLRWIWPEAELAHPFDDGTAVTLRRGIADTASQLGEDAAAYRSLYQPLVAHWHELAPDILGPLKWPRHPLLMARFGVKALQPATMLAKTSFEGDRARAFFAGLAAHSILKLEDPLSAAFGIILGTLGHAVGWPIPAGGAQQIAGALARVFESYKGRLRVSAKVYSLQELNDVDTVLCDVTPRQFVALAGDKIKGGYLRALNQYEYGPGVYKVDWALREPIPWRAAGCKTAGTIHLGCTLEEISESERAVWEGRLSARPFVLLAQPSLFDPSRAPSGRHTAWAYCHVPNGYSLPALSAIENQVERFAPGFKDCIIARHAAGPAQMQSWNENLVGGDINGGALSWNQFALRPTWRRYGTPIPGVYLCSSSTPPGGGVHGMCGYHAAKQALSRINR